VGSAPSFELILANKLRSRAENKGDKSQSGVLTGRKLGRFTLVWSVSRMKLLTAVIKSVQASRVITVGAE
jgi:hypothetical protein